MSVYGVRVVYLYTSPFSCVFIKPNQTHPQTAITWCASLQSVYFLVEFVITSCKIGLF